MNHFITDPIEAKEWLDEFMGHVATFNIESVKKGRKYIEQTREISEWFDVNEGCFALSDPSITVMSTYANAFDSYGACAKHVFDAVAEGKFRVKISTNQRAPYATIPLSTYEDVSDFYDKLQRIITDPDKFEQLIYAG